MVAVPNFIALAMENWGLIVYHESAMIYNPNRDSVYVKERVAMIVSHEIAHQVSACLEAISNQCYEQKSRLLISIKMRVHLTAA